MGTTRKITCKTFLEELGDYLEGDLDSDFIVEVEAHLAKCPDCWVVFDETKRTVAISRSVKCHPLPEDVHARLLDAIEKRWKIP